MKVTLYLSQSIEVDVIAELRAVPYSTIDAMTREARQQVAAALREQAMRFDVVGYADEQERAFARAGRDIQTGGF